MLFNQTPILAPQPTTYTIDAAPTINALNSINGLAAIDHNPGIAQWLLDTAHAIPPERHKTYLAICGMFGVHSLMRVVDPLPLTFPEYLDALQHTDAARIRDRIIGTLNELTSIKIDSDAHDIMQVDTDRILTDRTYYLAYLDQFDMLDMIDRDITLLAHHFLTHPADLKRELLDILTWIWDEHLAEEWARIRPTVQASVEVLRGIPTDGLLPMDAINSITGRNLYGILREDVVNSYTRIDFVPSTHNGPYITSLPLRDRLVVVFGARLPERGHHSNSRLDNAALLNRIKALGDEARLDILVVLHDLGEMSTAQIMAHFDLNKSAASRHLRNLRAAELISERRDDDGKGKFYRLNDDGVTEMLATIRELLG